MKLKRMRYTKDNGEVSERTILVVSEPKENYLTYDITDFSEQEREMLAHYMNSIEDYRTETLKEFEVVTGREFKRLWRSFKPGGIEWLEDND